MAKFADKAFNRTKKLSPEFLSGKACQPNRPQNRKTAWSCLAGKACQSQIGRPEFEKAGQPKRPVPSLGKSRLRHCQETQPPKLQSGFYKRRNKHTMDVKGAGPQVPAASISLWRLHIQIWEHRLTALSWPLLVAAHSVPTCSRPLRYVIQVEEHRLWTSEWAGKQADICMRIFSAAERHASTLVCQNQGYSDKSRHGKGTQDSTETPVMVLLEELSRRIPLGQQLHV